jgi:hypothetical protein
LSGGEIFGGINQADNCGDNQHDENQDLWHAPDEARTNAAFKPPEFKLSIAIRASIH